VDKFPHFPDRKSVSSVENNDLVLGDGEQVSDDEDSNRPPRGVLNSPPTTPLPVFRESNNIQDTLFPAKIPESINNDDPNLGIQLEQAVYRDGDSLEDPLYRAPGDSRPARPQQSPQRPKLPHHSTALHVPKTSTLTTPAPSGPPLFYTATTAGPVAYSTYSSPLYPQGRPTPPGPVYSSPAPPLPPGYELIPIHQLTPEHEVVPWEELPRLMERNNLTLDTVPLGPYNHNLHGRTTLRPSSLPHVTPYSAAPFSKPYFGSNTPPPSRYGPNHSKNFLLGSSYIPPPVSQDMGGIFGHGDHHLYAPKYGPPPATAASRPVEYEGPSEYLSTARPKYIHFGTHFANDKDANLLLPHYRYDPTISPAEISDVSPYPRANTASTAAPVVHVQTTFSSAPRVFHPTLSSGGPGHHHSTAFPQGFHTPPTLPPRFSASPSGGHYGSSLPSSPSGGYTTPSTVFFSSSLGSSTIPPPTQQPLSILPPPPHFAAPTAGLEPPGPYSPLNPQQEEEEDLEHFGPGGGIR
jgi:hypothetical protein